MWPKLQVNWLEAVSGFVGSYIWYFHKPYKIIILLMCLKLYVKFTRICNWICLRLYIDIFEAARIFMWIYQKLHVDMSETACEFIRS